LQTIKEQDRDKGAGPVTPPPNKSRHFLEAYADHDRSGAVTPVR
jgi:hypothetical protein